MIAKHLTENLEKIEPFEMLPGFYAKMIHTTESTFAFWDITEGQSLPKHQHFNTQTMFVIEGSFELAINNEPVVYKKGDIVYIQSMHWHSGTSITDCKLLDVFFPAREDYAHIGIKI